MEGVEKEVESQIRVIWSFLPRAVATLVKRANEGLKDMA